MKKGLTLRAKAMIAAGVSAVVATSTLASVFTAFRESEQSVAPDSKLYAVVVGNPEWPLSEPQRGIYSIGSDLTMTKKVASTAMSFPAAQPGFYADGHYYVNRSSVMVFPFASVQGSAIDVYDVTTGELVDSHTLNSSFINVALSFAYDAANDVVYAVTYGANANSTILTTFDCNKLEFSEDKHQISTRFGAMACDKEGNLYGIKSGSAQLLKINTSDGTVSDPITTWSETPNQSYPQAMIYDPERGCLLWSYTNNSQETKLISINPDPDNTRIQALGEGLGKYVIHGLYSLAPLADDNAPAQINDLEFEFTAPGELSGTISYTAPSVKISGDELNGTLNAKYYIDGTEVKTTAVNAGSKIVENLTFENEGKHKLSVVLYNGELEGPRTSLNVFAGFDTPSAVPNATASVNGNDVLLSWDAPQGINGGALGALTYTITHNGEKVETVSSTEYTYHVDGDVSVHTFTITPTAGDLTGESVTLGNIVAGNPIELPYSCDFSTADQFALYTSINANNDNTEWKWFQYGTQYAQCNKTYGDGPADDYLVTPSIKFEAGKVYSLRFDIETNGPRPEAMDVYLTEGTSLEAMGKGLQLWSDKEIVTDNKFVTKEILFTPESSGAANIAFHYCTEDGIRINLDNISIECYGEATAPKAATGLNVIPGANGALTAEFTFTTPDKCFNGDTLTDILKAEITRNGELIKTIEHPATGTYISYNDESVPSPGSYTYGVTIYNGSGAGQTVNVTEYVGAKTLPIECTSETGFEGFSFLNHGESGWSLNEETGKIEYSAIDNGSNNDVLSTPYFYLKKGEVVGLSFNYSVYNEAENAAQLGIWIGASSISQPNIQNLTPLLWVRAGEHDILPSNDYRLIVPEDGVYAFHMSTTYPSTNNTGIIINSLKIETASDPGVPNKVTNIGIQSDKEGKLEGKITFRMPLLTLDNKALEGTVDATIYGPKQEVVGHVEGVNPGETVQTDIVMTQGVQRYTVTPSNDKGIGVSETYTSFAGTDVPLRVVSPFSVPTSDNMAADISWGEPEEGVYKGWFDRSQLKYKVYVDGEYIETVDRPEYYYEISDPEQRVYKFGIVPLTNAGEGNMSDICVNLLGTPLNAPFEENFTGGTFDTKPWYVWWPFFEDCKWEPVADFKGEPAIKLQSYVMTESTAEFPKLTLSGMEHPELTFEHYKYHGEPPLYNAGQMIQIQISDDEVNYTTIASEMGESGSDEAEGWYKVSVPLDGYVDKPWISIKLFGLVHEDWDYAAVRKIKIAEHTSGVKDVEANNVTVTGGNGEIQVLGADHEIKVYDINGMLVARTSDNVVNVPAGIYIVDCGISRVKVTVK